jgi:hypothetical protein
MRVRVESGYNKASSIVTIWKSYSGSTRANYRCIASSDGQNISVPLSQGLKIFCLLKYRVCGATIYKTHFFFHQRLPVKSDN